MENLTWDCKGAFGFFFNLPRLVWRQESSWVFIRKISERYIFWCLFQSKITEYELHTQSNFTKFLVKSVTLFGHLFGWAHLYTKFKIANNTFNLLSVQVQDTQTKQNPDNVNHNLTPRHNKRIFCWLPKKKPNHPPKQQPKRKKNRARPVFIMLSHVNHTNKKCFSNILTLNEWP